jgi:hypothetical protein
LYQFFRYGSEPIFFWKFFVGDKTNRFQGVPCDVEIVADKDPSSKNKKT